MKKKFLFVLVLTLCLLSIYPSFKAVQANQSIDISQLTWKPFSSSEGGFRVLMPGTPTRKAGEYKFITIDRELEKKSAQTIEDFFNSFQLLRGINE